MSAYIRATPPPSSAGGQGSSEYVDASGIAIMSDSSIALKPVIEDPSNPIPPSNASSRSAALIENDFSWPRTSVNHRRMKRMPRSSTAALTSSCVMRRSVEDAGWRGVGPAVLPREPAVGPALELAQRGCELAALVGELVLDAH